MSNKKPTCHVHLADSVRCLLVVVSLVAICAVRVSGQAATDASTPPGLAPGAPAGSYALSGFDNINFYNGNLNFRLPLLRIGGRGSAGYTMTLKLEQKWLVQHWYDQFTNQHFYWPDPNWWSGIGDELGAGTVQARPGGAGTYMCDNETEMGPRFTHTFKRLTVTMPDGTEYELRDKLTNGQPKEAMLSYYCTSQSFNRGKEFVTADGSAATFISDVDIYDPIYADGINGPQPVSGYLYLRDGTRYRVSGGVITQIRDRNGNVVSVFDGNNSVVDSLGRQVTVQYGVTDPTFGTGTRINFSGYGGAARDLFISQTTLGNALRTGYTLQSPNSLFNLGSDYTNFNPTVVSSVWLPDDGVNHRRYQFFYNSYGELARVILPTGGAIEYDYQGGLTDGPDSGLIQVGYLDGGQNNYQVYRRVVKRRVYKDSADTTPESTLTVSRPEHYGSPYPYPIASDGYVETAERAGTDTGTILAGERHYYYGSAAASMDTRPGSFSSWREGREYKTETYNTNGTALTTVLRKVEKTEQQRAGISWWSWWATQFSGVDPNGEPSNDPRLVTMVTTVEPSGANLVSKQTSINPQDGSVGFDQYNNPTDLWEYDFGQQPGTVGAFVRRTHTDYLSSTTYTSATAGAHLRSLPTQQWVTTDVAGVSKASLTTYAYDQTALTPRVGITGHDAAFSTAYLTRGNVTGTTSYANAAAGTGAITSTSAYDIGGNVVSVTDPRGNSSQVGYADSFCNGSTCGGTFIPSTYAFPTSATSPVPDPTGQYGSTTALVTSTVYDFWTGQAYSITDANNKTTTLSYADGQGNLDPLDRLKSVTRPDGSKTDFNYSDTVGDLYVQAFTDLDTTRRLESKQYFDGLGRGVRSFKWENQDTAKPWLTVDTQYDALGRARRMSNQYRSAGPGSAVNPLNRWMESTFDALGRVTQVKTTADNAAVTTSYSGNSVTVTDQHDTSSPGHSRKSIMDALGRLTAVYEDPSGTFNYLTSYQYNVLGNLLAVTQDTQTRTFVYDSLSRLTSATNPESGTVGYTYDSNGNLLTKTDARGVTATYTYDKLNRNTTITYAGGGTTTPAVSRYYDSATNGRGKPYITEAAATAQSSFPTYDDMGRPTQYQQKFWVSGAWGQAYTVQYEYNKAGGVTLETYPSGHVVNYNYDAVGRPSDNGAAKAFGGNLGDGVSRTYASEVRYQEMGGMEQEKFGTDTAVFNKGFYNSRGQLAEIRVSTYGILASGHETDWNRGAIINHYSHAAGAWGAAGGGPDNNGNLQKQEIYIPDNDQITSYTNVVQQYSYDALNRLTSVYDKPNNGSPDYIQGYNYDRWGNRTIDQTLTTANAPKPNYTASATTNRLSCPAGYTMSYDAAGNLTYDNYNGGSGGGGTRAYDAENRMTSAQFVSGQPQTATYTYDADGHRVRRNMGAGGEVWQVYGVGGELLAEYAPNASPTQPQKEYGYRGGELLVTAEPSSNDTVWVEDSLPAGAVPAGDTDGWNWASANPTPYSGSSAHQSSTVAGLHQHFFYNATSTLTVSTGEKLVAYVYLDPSNAPSEVMLQWNDGTWEHRAYWGANQIGWGADGTESRRYMGALPASGQWVRLEVPASQVGLEGHTLNGMAFTLYGGKATWDRAGKSSGGTGAGVQWLIADQLGTPRMVIDKTGSLSGVKRHDYFPFGEEIPADGSWRTTARGYAGDNVRQKFTEYERDNETGLDYAQARYYASAQGRFTTVDPIFMSKDRILNPQELNLYTYCQNNPLIYTDPDGKYFVGTNGKKVQVSSGKNGLVVGRNGSADLKRMAKLINASGSEKAISRFLDVAQNVTRTNFKISKEEGTYTDPLNKQDTGPIFGYTQPHGKDGKPLEWSTKINNFNGTPEYIKDGNGNMVYKEVTITIYEGSLSGKEGLNNFQSVISKDPDITTDEAMVIMSHEETHTTDQEGIDNIRNKKENFDPEATPSKFHNEVHDEIEKNRNKKP